MNKYIESFRSGCNNILKEFSEISESEEFDKDQIVMLKGWDPNSDVNKNPVGKIYRPYGERKSGFFYVVNFPGANRIRPKKGNLNITDKDDTYWVIREKLQIIPEDQLIPASEEQLKKYMKMLISKYNVKSNDELLKYGFEELSDYYDYFDSGNPSYWTLNTQ